MAKLPLYLDYNATTPVAPEVVDAMLPFFMQHFGNPSSAHHYGAVARQAMAVAREQVAALVGARADEILFTGSATEANNLALLGVARLAAPHRRHLIISAIEHPAVTGPARHLQGTGWAVTVLPVDEYGLVDPQDLKDALRPDTALVSVMHANNEVGTIQPLAEIAALAHANGSLFHTDAAQSAGKIAVDVGSLGVDLLTLAGHKLYTPKGIGALYVRTGTPIAPAGLFGGGQERGLRSGTENVPYLVALGTAARLAQETLVEYSARVRALRDSLHARLAAAVPGLELNGHPERRLPNTLHVSFPGVSGSVLLAEAAEEVAASVGSACHGDQGPASDVLTAMRLGSRRALGAVRLSLGRDTTAADIGRAADALTGAFHRLNGAGGAVPDNGRKLE